MKSGGGYTVQNNIADYKGLELDNLYHIKLIQDYNEFDNLVQRYWINGELIFSVENTVRRNWADVHLFLNYDTENTNFKMTNFILTRATGDSGFTT